ncbi:zinc finger protein 726-like [Watersipora subatra]|uniref:zinc finger protein 726-like n=1 Tax=Watersipora subatra TaxID=2589382 RepID=UPI00355B9BB1
MKMTTAVVSLDKVLETDIMIDDDIDSLATLNIDIEPEADEDFDPNDFDCHSDVVSDKSDEGFKPPERGEKRETSSKRNAKLRSCDKVSRVPFTPRNKIKMIVTKKKILPRRKCVSADYNYTELDIEADDAHMYSLDCMKYARDIPATLNCKECDFTCTFNHQLTNSCKSHTSRTEKPYAFSHWEYRSVRSGSLQTRMKSHTGEKPYASGAQPF